MRNNFSYTVTPCKNGFVLVKGNEHGYPIAVGADRDEIPEEINPNTSIYKTLPEVMSAIDEDIKESKKFLVQLKKNGNRFGFGG